ncbi:O-antigen ligase family protein [Pseudonocardia sp. Cha107L01]|uniref:O-antigen ligase family protein n=1 Tax=Pseudonocardia sp. Cha107L01 TaxID=3457576 RepID=UPI00403EBF4F
MGLPSSARRWTWAATSVIILVAMLMTGSRTNLVLLAAFAGVVGSAHNCRLSPRKILGLLAGVGLTILVVTPVVAQFFVSDPTFLEGRLNEALTVVVGDANADGSYEARRAAYDLTAEAFINHIAFGTGPGYLYTLPPATTFGLDAPGIVPAKFGLIGIVIIGSFLASVAITVKKIRRSCGPSPGITSACGWTAVLITLIPFGPWIEDKGFAVALTILFGIIIADSRREIAEHVYIHPNDTDRDTSAAARSVRPS